MPIVVNKSNDRVADLIEELLDRLDDRPDSPAPVVNVAPASPVIRVEPAKVDVPAPVVNVAPATPEKGMWTFTVARNQQGLIETITARPTTI